MITETEKKGVFDSANCLKGLAIIAIVSLHVIFCSATENNFGATLPSTNVVYEIFFSGLMMLFLLSGYFYKPHSGYWKNVKKRVIQIVPPFLICGIVLTVFMGIWGNIYGCYSSPEDIFSAVIRTLTVNAFQPPLVSDLQYALVCPGYYYLATALCAMIIFYAIADWVRESWKHLAIVAAILLVLAALSAEFVYPENLPMRIDLVPIALLFMLVGTFMNKYEIIPLLENGWKTKKYWMLLIPLATIGILFAIFFPSYLQFSDNFYGAHGGWSAFTYFVLSVGCGYLLMAFCGVICRIKPLTKILTLNSRYIMYILLLDPFFVKIMATPFFGMTHDGYFPAMPLWAQILLIVLSIALSIITAYVSFKTYYWLKSKIKNRASRTSEC